ncbi:MAG: universal stress protein [Haloferacaceae archaeon]
MTLSVDLVVVPVDGSDESATAVEYALAVAAEYDAVVHAVYVLDETAVRAIEDGDADAEAIREDTDLFLDDVRVQAEEADVPLRTSVVYGFSTRVKTRHPGSVVLDTAEQDDADFLVVPRESVLGGAGDTLERAAEYVLLYASQPVLSV